MSRLVEWFVDNPIAANLLMLLIIFGGITTVPKLDKEFFPQEKLNRITITVPYPGAGPAEVEQQICLRIEEVIADLDGIEKLTSLAREGSGTVTIEVDDGYDSQRLLNDIKSRVDAINTFPAEVERPNITELRWKSQMVSVVLAGDIDEASLKELGERMRDQIASLPEVNLVELRKPRDYEVSIEVSELDLRRYGLRFDDISAAIRLSSMNLPAGKIKTEAGDLQLQTRSQAYTGADFEQIVVLKNLDGTELRLGDIATIIDGFADSEAIARFDGMPSLSLDVYATTRPDVLKTSEAIAGFVETMRPSLPPGVEMSIWRDRSVLYKGRIHTLISNGIGGLALVFILLMLFLRPQLAFWVCAGIAVAFLGALWFLPLTATSLNMVTLFAFILILGIIVDDAIIVGESVYAQHSRGAASYEAAKSGAKLVLTPVLFAVISTMIFFAPMYLLSGDQAAPKVIPSVVLAALFFSLLESMLILPAHLRHMKPERPVGPDSYWFVRWLATLRGFFARAMARAATDYYRPMLERCMAWRGLTMVLFGLLFLLSVALMAGGWLRSSFFPRVPIDAVLATATYSEGSSFAQVRQGLEQMDTAAQRLKSEYNHRYAKPVIGHIEAAAYETTARLTVELSEAQSRDVSAEQLKRELEQSIGVLPNVEEFELRYTIIPLGKPITLQLSAPDIDTLKAVSAELRGDLSRYPGVYNVTDSLQNPRSEIELRLQPSAHNLDLQLSDLARQVRQGFYGEEVQRIPRSREDVKVMLRYPAEERNNEHYLHELRIRTATGLEVPFDTVAELHYVPGYRQIEREDRKRIATVSADLQAGFASASEIIAAQAGRFKQWQQRYPGLEISAEGEEKERNEFVASLVTYMGLSMLVIYGLIAIVFRSYWQPFLVLSAIPFGFVGAVLGHLLMGRDVSMFSMLGIIAAAGVVVNDNLVLIDHVNRLRSQGLALRDALVNGAQDRFRPIILTSMTTFIGLVPIMSEQSLQAQFLIPMVISLAFGVLVATFVTLLFVPVFYMAGERLKDRVSGLFSRATA